MPLIFAVEGLRPELRRFVLDASVACSTIGFPLSRGTRPPALSRNEGLPLATLDQSWRAAATQAGVELMRVVESVPIDG
jgi:hypothetical protein